MALPPRFWVRALTIKSKITRLGSTRRRKLCRGGGGSKKHVGMYFEVPYHSRAQQRDSLRFRVSLWRQNAKWRAVLLTSGSPDNFVPQLGHTAQRGATDNSVKQSAKGRICRFELLDGHRILSAKAKAAPHYPPLPLAWPDLYSAPAVSSRASIYPHRSARRWLHSLSSRKPR